MIKLKYTDISGWKYRLDERVAVRIDVRKPFSSFKIDDYSYIYDDQMVLLQGYMWDGPSGPTIDTPGWMLPSAVHDAFYRILKTKKTEDIARLEVLELSVTRTQLRKYADDLMYDMLVENGVWKFRAQYSWAAVRMSPWAAWQGWPWEKANKWL